MAEKPSTRLDSWKEIAAYLGRDTRTVLRWEKERGLPVHRVPGGKRHAVFAYREEIDTWLAGQPPNHVAPEAPRRDLLSFLSKPLMWFALLVLIVSGAQLIRLATRPGDAQLVKVAGQQLSVLDADQKLIWDYRYPRPLAEYDPSRQKRWLRLTDLDGDGKKELPFIATLVDPGNPEAPSYTLDCFSSEGKLLWRYTPSHALNFSGQPYKGPWTMSVLDVTASPRGPQIWLGAAHTVWWPAFLVKLDAAGRDQLAFVNSGHIYALSELRTSSGPFLLAGGVNNEYSAGMLAVLDVAKLPATSPQTSGSQYHCDACPPGAPHRYFVFPRSELNLVEAAPYNAVWAFRFFDGEFEVTTIELAAPGVPVDTNIFQGRYLFSNSFELLESFRSDAYWDAHRRLEREGKIKHSVDQCPERTRPTPIRMWSPETGWQEILPRSAATK